MDNNEQRLSIDQLLIQIQSSVLLRCGEDQVLWTMFGIFWAANAILLVAIFNSGSLPKELWVISVISTSGTFMNLIWHWVQSRALGNLIKFEELTLSLENESIIPLNHRTSKSPDDVYNRLLGSQALWYLRSPRARKLLPFCSISLTVIWGITASVTWIIVILN